MALVHSPTAPAVQDASPSTGVSSRSPSASIVRGALALLSTQPITWAASALAAIITPRFLGDQALGAFAYAWTIAGLAGVFVTLGVPEYLVRRVASRRTEIDSVGGAALVLVMGVAALAAVALAFLLPLLGYPAGDVAILRWALIGMVAVSAQALLLSLLRAQEQHGRFAWLNAGGVVMSNAACVAALIMGGGVAAYAAAITLTQVTTTVMIWYASGSRIRRASFAPALLRQLARGGIPFLGWSVALRFRMEVDKLLLGILASAAVIGWYAAAYRIIGVTVFIPTLITTPLLPALSRYQGDRSVFDQTLRRCVVAALFLMVPICAVTVAVAPAIPGLLHWPDAFDNSIPLMMILALQMPLVAVDMVIGTGLIALHRERAWLVVAVVAAGCNVLANVLLITLFQRSTGNGALGAAFATLATEFVMVAGALILLPRGIINGQVLRTGGAIVLAGACLSAVTYSLLGFSLPLAVAAGGGTFLLVGAALRVYCPSQIWAMRDQAIRSLVR
jgi:O-antigen/teichoic acid export membrane protein